MTSFSQIYEGLIPEVPLYYFLKENCLYCHGSLSEICVNVCVYDFDPYYCGGVEWGDSFPFEDASVPILFVAVVIGVTPSVVMVTFSVIVVVSMVVVGSGSHEP